jgi:hypothetical protein
MSEAETGSGAEYRKKGGPQPDGGFILNCDPGNPYGARVDSVKPPATLPDGSPLERMTELTRCNQSSANDAYRRRKRKSPLRRERRCGNGGSATRLRHLCLERSDLQAVAQEYKLSLRTG